MTAKELIMKAQTIINTVDSYNNMDGVYWDDYYWLLLSIACDIRREWDWVLPWDIEEARSLWLFK